jgi:NADH dehydrogenase
VSQARCPHIVILGAGFAGIHVARELARLLPRAEDGRITLVDQNNFMVFTPLLTEVAGGEVDADHIISAVRRLSPRVSFVQGRVDGIDLANRRVTIAVGGTAKNVPRRQENLDADQLVIALGSVTNFHGLAGVQEHALTIKSVGDAAAIRARALELLEYAAAEADGEKRRALLTVVVAGGGFSGVETMAALNDLVRDEAKSYPHIAPQDVRTMLVHPGKRLLPELSAGLARYAQTKLEQRGVEVILDIKITGAGPDYAEMEGGRRVPTHLLIWTAGVTPSPVIGTLDVKRGHHGGIVVNACCAVPGHPGTWALGDCAEVPRPGGKAAYAPTAQNAMREGTQVARNIVAVLHGQQPRPFVYTPIGELALVGKRSGVASLYGLHLSGLSAWALWRAIYLAKMPRLGQRLRIGFDWLLDLLFGREIAALPLTRSTPPAGETASQC